MLTTFLDLQNTTRSRLMSASGSTVFTTARVKELINNANQLATSRHNWPELERAKETGTVNGQDYYDYPDEFKTDSLTRLQIDGKTYYPKNFNDFLRYREGDPLADKRIFADYARQYFVYPTPTADGTLNISVWGIIQAPELTLDADVTIFSYSDVAGNDAICDLAVAEGIEKINPKLAAIKRQNAYNTLDIIWGRVAKRQQKYQRLDHPKFSVPNFFGRAASPIGNFNVEFEEDTD